jgi:hypothetical protein
MSFTAAHESTHARPDCHVCRDRQVRFRFRGDAGTHSNHVLCFECYRSKRSRQLARHLTEDPHPHPSQSPPSPFGGMAEALTARQVAHRSLMLGHLSATSKEKRKASSASKVFVR